MSSDLYEKSTDFLSETLMRGYIRIKRKRFWVIRYAEIKNNEFFYYKSKGCLNKFIFIN